MLFNEISRKCATKRYRKIYLICIAFQLLQLASERVDGLSLQPPLILYSFPLLLLPS
jgi:hypothetical protein